MYGVPGVLLSQWAGVLADKSNQLRLMIASDNHCPEPHALIDDNSCLFTRNGRYDGRCSGSYFTS
jgi:hypothetical protein